MKIELHLTLSEFTVLRDILAEAPSSDLTENLRFSSELASLSEKINAIDKRLETARKLSLRFGGRE